MLLDEVTAWAGKSPVPPDLRVDHPNPAATFWIQATRGVTYARATLPARHLPGRICDLNETDLVMEGAHITSDGKIAPSARMPRQGGKHAIWSFPGSNTRAILIAELQEHGVRCFFECDDDYTIRPDVGNVAGWLTRYRNTDEHSYEIATRIAAFCDGIIVSTPKLADVYAQINDNVNVCRNCVDPDDWPDVQKPDDGVLRVGWAASASHARDSQLVKPALRWLAGRPDVEIVMIGLNPEFPFPYTHVPWTDSVAAYRLNLGVLDVMLCPLRRTEWADAKSDIKALEAAMAGAMSVVSDSPAYDLWHDRTFVCETEKDWLRTVRHLYKNRNEVADLQAAHRAYVLRERRIQEGVQQWHRALATVS